MRRAGYISPLAVIGEPPQDRSFAGKNITPIIHAFATVEALAQVDAGTRRPTYIHHDAWLMKGCHVGHDAIIGPRSEVCPGVVVSGWVEIGADVRIGVGAVFKPYVKVGDEARIGAGAVVITNVPAGETWAGNPAHKL